MLSMKKSELEPAQKNLEPKTKGSQFEKRWLKQCEWMGGIQAMVISLDWHVLHYYDGVE